MGRTMNGGLHVGLIMDGNGRWASARGLLRTEGHRRGADAVRRAVEAAPGLGVTTLTLYAFSADNWRRPAAEVSALMSLLESFLVRERASCRRQGVRLALIGRRDRLSPALIRAIEETERATHDGARLYLRLAVDYSARAAILAAAGTLRTGRTVRRERLPAAGQPRVPLRSGDPAGRSRHPHERRAAPERLPAVRGGLRRAALHRNAVAGLRRRRPAPRGRGVPPPRAPLRRSAAGRGRSRQADRPRIAPGPAPPSGHIGHIRQRRAPPGRAPVSGPAPAPASPRFTVRPAAASGGARRAPRPLPACRAAGSTRRCRGCRRGCRRTGCRAGPTARGRCWPPTGRGRRGR